MIDGNQKPWLVMLVVGVVVLAGAAFMVCRNEGYAGSQIRDTQEKMVEMESTGTYTLSCESSHSPEQDAADDQGIDPLDNTQPKSTEGPSKVIYLTFDDGPGKNTEKLLGILRKYNVKATFFLINSDYAHLIEDIAADGHSVGIHSASHQYRKIYASSDAFFNDLYKMQQIIKDYSGKTTMLMRFPGGSSNTVSSFNPGIMTKLTKAVTEKGFQYVDWNVDSGDAAGACSTNEVYHNVIQGIKHKDIAVVLQHDTQGFSVDAVERIIVWGKENGYAFRALDESSPQFHHDVSN